MNKVIASVGRRCIVNFTEAGRSSWLGKMNDKQNVVTWLQMRRIISELCNLHFITDKRNNEDPSGMPFAISAFCTTDIIDSIETYFGCSILNEGFGCAAVGIKMVTGEIFWSAQFPLDFRGVGENNLGYKAMIGLMELMNKYKGSVFAIADFNAIPGVIADAINLAIANFGEYQLLLDSTTFYGSYFDTVKVPKSEHWVELLTAKTWHNVAETQMIEILSAVLPIIKDKIED